MDNENSEFFKHLLNFGLVSKKSINDLQNIYSRILIRSSNTNIPLNFQNAMCATLMYYLNSIDEEKQKEISLSIIMNYFDSKSKKILKTLKKQINFLILKNDFYKKYSLKLALLKWRTGFTKPSPPQNNLNHSFATHISNNNKNTPNTLNKSNSISYLHSHLSSKMNKDYRTYTPNTIKKKKRKLDVSSSRISQNSNQQTTWDRKEQEEFEQCTFHPQTNNISSMNRSNIPVFERLYKVREKYASRKQARILERDHFISSQLSFTPEFFSRSINNSKNSESFQQRQESFFINKKLHQDQIINQLDEEYENECSFVPKINKGSNFRKKFSPTHIRLCQKNIKKDKKKSKNLSDVEAYMNSSLSKSNIATVDADKIEKLYNEYKTKPKKIKDLKEAYEKEEGITFEPKVNKENKYYSKITMDFFERGRKLLRDKDHFVKLYNQENEKYWKDQQINNKEYSETEKEEITKRIINHLYGSKPNCNYSFTNFSDKKKAN